MRLCTKSGATVTLRVGHALTSAKVPSEKARYANTCAVKPSAVSVWLNTAVTPALLVEEVSVDGDTVTTEPVNAYARMPVTVAVNSPLTESVFDAPAAERVKMPALFPVTDAPETVAMAVSELEKVASALTSASTRIGRPTPPKSASSRKSAVSYVQGDSRSRFECVANKRVESGYHTRNVTDVEKPPLDAVTIAAALPSVLLAPSETVHPPPCATATESTVGAFVVHPPAKRVTAESPGDARGVP